MAICCAASSRDRPPTSIEPTVTPGKMFRIEINCAERAACEQHEQDEDNDERGGMRRFLGEPQRSFLLFSYLF